MPLLSTEMFVVRHCWSPSGFSCLISFPFRYVRVKPDNCKVQLVYRALVPTCVDMLQPEVKRLNESRRVASFESDRTGVAIAVLGGKLFKRFFTEAVQIALFSPDGYQN